MKAIQHNEKWSKWVQDRWQNEAVKASEYVPEYVEPSTYKVRHKNRERIERRVVIGDFPTCDCIYFCSSLIPCRHIACVFPLLKTEALFSKKTLHPRWKLKNHPLYERALQNLGLSNAERASTTQVERTDAAVGSPDLLESYRAILAPKSEDQRYVKVIDRCKELAKIASSDAHRYRLALLEIEAAIEAIRNGKLGSTVPCRAPQALVQKRAHPSKNASRLKVKPSSKKPKRQCSACGATSHRSDSQRCPMRQCKMSKAASTTLAKNTRTDEEERLCSVCKEPEKSGRACSICSKPVHHYCSNEILSSNEADRLGQSQAICSEFCKAALFSTLD